MDSNSSSMTMAQSRAVAFNWTLAYAKYVQYISKVQLTADQVSDLVADQMKTLMPQWETYCKDRNSDISFGDFVTIKTDELRRLNEYHEKYGITEPETKGTGGRYWS